MTYRDLYLTAVGMTGEDISDDCIADYEESATYLLATFCRECADIDARYRTANGLKPTTVSKEACVDLDASFPLSDALTPAASYYLAAMLVADENEDLSDRFFTLYTDSVSALMTSLPTSRSSVSDCYGLLK